MKKIRKTERTYSVDRLMLNIASTLVRDFRYLVSDPSFCSTFLEAVRAQDVEGIRREAPTPEDSMDVTTYKATYQIQNLLKRYRFEKDLYSDEELTQKAIQGFLDTQSRLAVLDLDALPTDCQRVLDLAAGYLAKLLGRYDDEEHRLLCRFGRRASVGVPARKACLAERLELPISGSPGQIAWFDSEMSQDEMIQDYWLSQLERDPQGSIYQVTEALTLTLVPKSFKSLRSIMPNTTIGSYMSYGLGEMIRKRLKKEGYDISTLQERHKVLARRESLINQSVTADLSSASDSISVALVQRLLPPDWLEVLNQSRIGVVQLPNSSECITSLTYCTMGIGYTFPLQTAIFLSLLKAIEATLYHRLDRRTISVYGDDLIYNRRMHDAVVYYFQKFGFVINLDKTFHDGHFRESCGGDYYHGVDVRPFQPRNDSVTVGSHAYEAVLYKYINTLLMRWSEYEIEETLRFLVSEVEHVTGTAKLVPYDFPDDAGVRCERFDEHQFLPVSMRAQPKSVGHGLFRFSYLRFTPEEREEKRHVPYLWEALRGLSSRNDFYCVDDRTRKPDPESLAFLINKRFGFQDSVGELIPRTSRSATRTKSGRRLRRISTFVTVSHTGRYTRQSGISCFGTRRK